MTSQGTVAKYLSEEPKDCVRRRDDAGGNCKSSYRSLKKRTKPALCLLPFPFEVGIRHDSGTFNATHLAGIVFLFRDTI